MPDIPYALELLTPICPACGHHLANRVPVISLVPYLVKCPCGWVGNAVFFREQRDYDFEKDRS